MAVANAANKITDGKAIPVTLSSAVSNGDLIYVSGWLGIANDDGVSGATIGMTIEDFEYVFHVGSGINPQKGNIVYIDTTQLTGHLPTLAGYSLSSGSNLIRAFKATKNKDSNNYVRGRFLGGYHLS